MKQKQDIKPTDSDGGRHGEWIHYHNNGVIRYKRNYHHGKLHGECINYYSNGDMWYIINYHHDKQKGLTQDFNEDGILI